ncbi:hypothetical protein ACFSVJ_17255 [Prauserella oleivorans]
MVTLLPTTSVLVVVPELPDGTLWVWVPANAVAMAAVVQPATHGDRSAGSGSADRGRLAQRLGPAQPHARAGSVSADLRWPAAAVLEIVAAAVHVRTGSTTAYRRRAE